MANRKVASEPAVSSGGRVVSEPATATEPIASEPVRDARRLVQVYDVTTGIELSRPVPETHLSIFPHLREVNTNGKED